METVGNRGVPTDLPNLETFLVEWKLPVRKVRDRLGQTLKPS